MKKLDHNAFYYVIFPSGYRQMIMDRKTALNFAAAYGFTVTDPDGKVIKRSEPVRPDREGGNDEK